MGCPRSRSSVAVTASEAASNGWARVTPVSSTQLRRCGADADVKWSDSIFLVRRSYTREVMQSTKTGKRQAIVLPAELLDVLRWHVETQLETEQQRKSELLFPSAEGRFRARDVLRKPFDAIAERMWLPYEISPKAMRRTFQDLARAAEVHDLVTRSISGQVTDAMQRHYSTVGDKSNVRRSRR